MAEWPPRVGNGRRIWSEVAQRLDPKRHLRSISVGPSWPLWQRRDTGSPWWWCRVSGGEHSGWWWWMPTAGAARRATRLRPKKSTILRLEFASRRELCRPVLTDIQRTRCFYCRGPLTTAGIHSGHFIAWARHPVDLGHSSWMLQPRLRRVALIGGPIKIVVTCGGSYGRREGSR